MEISLTPEQQKALEGLAAQNGTTPTDQARLLIEDALKRLEDYDRWFRGQVREGLAAAERGEFIEHEDVGRMLGDRYRG
jgi:predicted transcriptional regulator